MADRPEAVWPTDRTVYGGTSSGHRKCDVCQQDIPQGSCEYELDFQGVRVMLDRPCFAVWQSEKLSEH